VGRLLAFRFVFPLITYCLVLGGGASEARGSCGDWLAHAVPLEQSPENGSDSFPSPRNGCEGPKCEKAPEAPLPQVPVESRPPVPDEWLMGDGAEESEGAARKRAIPSEVLVMSSERAERLDRPPEV
jgi:hypothetical protein